MSSKVFKLPAPHDTRATDKICNRHNHDSAATKNVGNVADYE